MGGIELNKVEQGLISRYSPPARNVQQTTTDEQYTRIGVVYVSSDPLLCSCSLVGVVSLVLR